MLKQRSLYILILFALSVASCKSSKTADGKKLFVGSIVYDISIEGSPVNQALIDAVKEKYGSTMMLTVYKNGDILKKYSAGSTGYDLNYLNVADNEMNEKYQSSDTIYKHKASKQNMVKLNNLRDSEDQNLTVLNYPCKSVALAGEKVDYNTAVRQYLTVKYWYSDDIVIDKSKYANVNEDLLGYLLNESNGGLFLKQEINYFTHKITFTAKEIRYKDFNEDVQLLDESSIIVEQ
jgi:hypothetical protein